MNNASTKPARGMRDFLPSEVRKREYVIGVIKEVYEKYGFEPLETPSIENLETLTNKYGDEGDQLMFKILKRGEKLEQELKEGGITNENDLTDLALRYDLTVPLARVFANYRNDLPKFFKRYQIQPVWRADRPAKGRYREFYQCDVDAIGSRSMVVEAELCSAVCEIFRILGFEDFEIVVNHRKILTGILEIAGIEKERHADALVAMDKLDKIGITGVLREFEDRMLPSKNIKPMFEFVHNILDNFNMLVELQQFLGNSEVGLEGTTELSALFDLLDVDLKARIKIDPTLARGLSYYTGAIFEVRVPDLAGSLAGGGRYDRLIGMFGKDEIPACGLSLGLERIIVVMDEREMFPADISGNAADVLVTIWSDKTVKESLKLASELRGQGLRVLVYPEADKLGKQLKYADQIGIPLVCVLGENEITEGLVSLKVMKSGDQQPVPRKKIAGEINEMLGNALDQ